MKRLVAPRPHPVVSSFLVSLLVLLSCGAPQGEETVEHQVVQSLLPLWPGPEALGRSVHPPKTRWFETTGGKVPAFFSASDFNVEIPLPRTDATFRATCGFFAPAGDLGPPTKVQFRALLRTKDGTQEEVLLDQEFTGTENGESYPIESLLPKDWPEASVLRLEARYLSKGRLRAAWVDPRVQWSRRTDPAPDRSPNLLLITSDTTRQDTLGVYGGPAPTPSLQALARDSILFHNAFSVAFGTTPSHSSLFTASHPADHGVYDNATVLAEEKTTLAEVLRDKGYATAAFVGARPVTHRLGLDQGFDRYDDLFLPDPTSPLGRNARHERRADLVVSRALQWLGHAPPQPFFLWLHVFDAHQPYLPPETESSTLDPRVEALFTESRGHPIEVRITPERVQDPLRPAIEQRARERYAGEVTFLDRQLGRVFARLRADDLYDDTLIVFTADHGENMTEHEPNLSFRHQGLHGGVARLPLLLKLPGSEFGGTSEPALLGNLDIAPTLIDLLGLEAPDTWSGRSFRRLLGPSEADFRPHLVLEGAHRHEISVRTLQHMYREIRPDFRQPEIFELLGFAPGQPVEFYDLESDPEEGTDLSTDDPEELKVLQDLVQSFLAQKQPVDNQKLESEEHLKALEALGYVDR